MRPLLVVMASVVLDHYAGLSKAEHYFPIQALVPQRSVEAFHMSVLPGAARFDVEGLYASPFQPVLEGAGDELAPVVAADIDCIAGPLQLG